MNLFFCHTIIFSYSFHDGGILFVRICWVETLLGHLAFHYAFFELWAEEIKLHDRAKITGQDFIEFTEFRLVQAGIFYQLICAPKFRPVIREP